MDFNVLGPVEVRAAGELVDTGPPRQRCVLAALVVDAGRPVLVGTLIDRVWGEAPPERARHALYVYIARLRRVIRTCAARTDASVRLVHRSGGYLLEAGRERVDALQFRWLVQQSDRHPHAQVRQAELLREALDLWRGDALADVPGEWAARVRQGWHQQRIDAAVTWGRLQLRIGGPSSVISRLTDLVAEDPLCEPLAALLIRALHGAGHGVEALACYARLRERLGDEIGADPSAELQDLYRAILRGDLDRSADQAEVVELPVRPAQTGAPAQLPLDVNGFTGRRDELNRLDEILATAQTSPNAVVVCAVSGTAGVGKTAVAVHWAQRVAHRFPDGQLYVNLRGFDPSEVVVPAFTAMRWFLRSLDVASEQIPTEPDELGALYRSTLAGRRMLIVLDNASDAGHVRPLLPGAPGCLVVATSRNELAGLVATENARVLVVDPLPMDDARDLMAVRLGADRVTTATTAVDHIIDRCARLPLALTIAAARASLQPHLPLQALADDLNEAGNRLDVLDAGDAISSVRAVFSWSYRTLSDRAATLFRLLGLHPGPDASAEAAASLLGAATREMRPLLDELIRAHLLVEHRPGRFTYHDLLRAYAVDLTDRAESRRCGPLHRLLDHYLHTAVDAALVMEPNRQPVLPGAPQPGVTPETFADATDAMVWFQTEHRVLMAMIQRAGANFPEHAWHLAWTMWEYLDRQGYWADWVTVQRLAVEAAGRTDDRVGRERAHRGLALACARVGLHAEATHNLLRCADLHGELKDDIALARTHLSLGWVEGLQERWAEALPHSEDAMEIFRAHDDRLGQAHALASMAWQEAHLGRYEPARARCAEALVLHADLADLYGHADTLSTVAFIELRLGRTGAAAATYQESLKLDRSLGDRYAEAQTLAALGDAHRAGGDTDAARHSWAAAMVIFDELGHPAAGPLRVKLHRAP